MNELRPFRFWVQNALPLVYDDSLSYYELLCKVVDYINKLIGNDKELVAIYEQLEKIVNDFIDSADIPAIVEEKLDEMIDDGTIEEILEQIVSETYVSPESYGAVGDGVTDDTNAWQSAVDSGKNVRAKSSTYKCGKINVANSIDIDCNNASFIMTENTLFNIAGEEDTTVLGAPYVADTAYSMPDGAYSNYTGFAVIKGDNNFVPLRNYYYGGFVCTFKDGNMCESYPINANKGSTVDVLLVSPIRGSIKNINGCISSVQNSTVISITYGNNYKIENVKGQFNAYKIIEFNYCYKCSVSDCMFDNIIGSTGTNSYGISLTNSSYCTIEKCRIFNKYWHAVTTGGNYLDIKNVIRDCELINISGGAFDDHENAFYTTIENSTIFNVVTNGMATIRNCIVCSSSSQPAVIVHQGSTVEKLSGLTVDNVIFEGDTVNGIYFAAYPQVDGNNIYYDNINISNVKSDKNFSIRLWISAQTNSYWYIKRINITNSNVTEIILGTTIANINVTNEHVTITNCRQSELRIGGNVSYENGAMILANSSLRQVSGKYLMFSMCNCDVMSSFHSGSFMAKELYANSCKAFFYTNAMLTGDATYNSFPMMIDMCMDQTGKPILNGIAVSATKKIYQRYTDDELETVILE